MTKMLLLLAMLNPFVANAFIWRANTTEFEEFKYRPGGYDGYAQSGYDSAQEEALHRQGWAGLSSQAHYDEVIRNLFAAPSVNTFHTYDPTGPPQGSWAPVYAPQAQIQADIQAMDRWMKQAQAQRDDEVLMRLMNNQDWQDDTAVHSQTVVDEYVGYWVQTGQPANTWIDHVSDSNVKIQEFYLVDNQGYKLAAGNANPHAPGAAGAGGWGLAFRYYLTAGVKMQNGLHQQQTYTEAALGTREAFLSFEALAEMGVGVNGVINQGELMELLAVGTIGAKASISAEVKNGITAAITAAITADASALMASGTVGIVGQTAATAKANIAFTVDIPKMTATAGGEVFAGFTATGTVRARWFNLKAGAKFGAGATAKVAVTKGVFSFDAGVAVGPGVDIGFDICVPQIVQDVVTTAQVAHDWVRSKARMVFPRSMSPTKYGFLDWCWR